MKGNYIAKNMNLVNRNSVHASLKNKLLDDDDYWIEEGIDQYEDDLQEAYHAKFAKELSPTNDS
jgi:hypothetical protein